MSRTPRPLIRPGGPVATLFAALVVGFVRRLPRGLRRALAAGLAGLAYALGIRRRVALDNLGHAFADLTEAERRAIARGAYRHLAEVALDSVVADQIPDAELEETVVVDDWGALGAALEKGGVLIASAHLGSWELLPQVMARRQVKLSAVVRPLEGAFNAKVVAARQAAGVELIVQRGALKHMIRAVRAGRCVVQLIDQSLPAEAGVFVPFFGRMASTTPALSMAALRTKAPVFVVVSVRDGDRHRFFFEGPIPVVETGDRRADVAAHTAKLTAVIEGYVRRYPSQWLWLHRRWKVQPP
ncbi:MAG: lipid A biosynthesis acyltransferase [Myxococcaceae bacterium]|nr:lipid A biosynthesis acyltransferase [Myxococcaceae bacterium]